MADNRLNKVKFASRLKEARTISGKKLKEVGEDIGVTPQCISKYEKGIIVPSAETLLLLAEEYKVSSDWLLKGTETARNENKELTTSDLFRFFADTLDEQFEISPRRIGAGLRPKPIYPDECEFAHLDDISSAMFSEFFTLWQNLIEARRSGALLEETYRVALDSLIDKYAYWVDHPEAKDEEMRLKEELNGIY